MRFAGEEMKEVFLTVGPRAAGKSSFCRQAIERDPSLGFVSRDDILVGIFGKTMLDPYSGGHGYAEEVLWKTVERSLGTAPDVRLLLDMWNGSSRERRDILRRLRELEVERVVAWYFVTPVERVEEWFWNKPGIAKWSEMYTRKGEGLAFYQDDAPRRDYELFHRLAAHIDEDGFDEVVRINPVA